MPDINEKAPEFVLTDEQEQPFALKDHLGDMLLLVFYPADDTPVCTRQLCDYRDGIESFRNLGVRVVGISRDDAASHRAFKEKHKLPFTLLSDPDLEVAELYESKGIMGMKRSVFLVDRSGLIRYRHIETLSIFRRASEELIDVISALGDEPEFDSSQD